MRRGILLLCALALVMATLKLTFRHVYRPVESTAAPVILSQGRTLILDAGHGGEDGGAVSITGVSESQVNLSIVLKMDDILGLYGVSPVLLRDQDVSIHDSTANTLREKKVSDLKNRVALISAQPEGTLISIHQNTFTQSQYSGAHVFYAPTDGSQAIAEHFQAALRTSLQPENDRQVKKIPDTVYLMNHIDCPAVLVECGFLSNPEEEAMLCSEDYQRKLAAVLSAACLSLERT